MNSMIDLPCSLTIEGTKETGYFGSLLSCAQDATVKFKREGEFPPQRHLNSEQARAMREGFPVAQINPDPEIIIENKKNELDECILGRSK